MKKTAIFLLVLLTAALACCNSAPTNTMTPVLKTTAEDAINDARGNSARFLPEPTAMVEDFPVLRQYPELPTGCEVTSLTMVLNYNGIEADKCDIADNYLKKGEVGTTDFRKAFVGDPRDEDSFGCYAPVLVKTANSYLSAKNSKLKATDLSGTELDALLLYIDRGVPVIIWGTQNCKTGSYTEEWEINGTTVSWYYPEHCMVLLGYSDVQVWVADPLKGEVLTFDRVIFKLRYEELFRQAIVIE